MSFYTNGINLNKITYNGADVSSVYYNNQLVWESPIPFWSEVYDVCKQRQAGLSTPWPEGVYLGAVAEVEFHEVEKRKDYGKISFVNDKKTLVPVVLVDIESEGPGTLIFQQLYVATESNSCLARVLSPASIKKQDELLLNSSDNHTYYYLRYTNINKYIRPIRKIYSPRLFSIGPSLEDLKYFWDLSINECGVPEYIDYYNDDVVNWGYTAIIGETGTYSYEEEDGSITYYTPSYITYPYLNIAHPENLVRTFADGTPTEWPLGRSLPTVSDPNQSAIFVNPDGTINYAGGRYTRASQSCQCFMIG